MHKNCVFASRDSLMKKKGFTLIELIMVMLILSILTIFSLNKISLFSGWNEAGVAKEIAFILHSAQNLAIANHRNIFVLMSSSNVSVCYDIACVNPAKSVDGKILMLSPPSGSFTYTTSSVSFDSKGRPSFSGGPLISYGSESVSLESETGLIW